MHVAAVNQNMFNIEFSILPKIGVPIYSVPSLKLSAVMCKSSKCTDIMRMERV